LYGQEWCEHLKNIFFIPQNKKKGPDHRGLWSLLQNYTIRLKRNAESNENSPSELQCFFGKSAAGVISRLSETSSCDRSHLLSDQPAWQQHAQSHAERRKGGCYI